MTVIVWDGEMLAADKQATNGGLARTVTKIRRIGDLLCGVSGDISTMAELFAWVERGRKPEDWPACQRTEHFGDLLVIEGGRALKYEQSPYPTVMEDRQYAMGSGRDYAMGALECGKDAFGAVEVACELDVYSGVGVDWLKPEYPKHG